MVKEEQVLTSSEFVKKINDYYHNGSVLVYSDFGYCKINIANTDHLMAEESDQSITLRDDLDLEIVIDKSSISKSTLSDFENDEEITVDLGNSNLSFLLCS